MLTRTADAVRLWDAITGLPLAKLENKDDRLELTAAALSPDGKRAATASIPLDPGFGSDLRDLRRPVIRVWDIDGSARPLRVQPIVMFGARSHDGRVNSVAFSKDGTKIITASDDKTAKIWKAETGECARNVSQECVVVRLQDRGLYAAFSPNGDRVVIVSDNDAAQVWNAADGKSVGQPMTHARRINTAEFSPDGTQIVTASDDGTAGLWDASSGEAVAKSQGMMEGSLPPGSVPTGMTAVS